MNTKHLILLLLVLSIISCKSESKEIALQTSDAKQALQIHPISHATMVLEIGKTSIFVDPTGGVQGFSAYGAPDIVLITDIHGDHYNINTLEAMDLSNATVIAPKAVVDKYPSTLKIGTKITLNNGDSTTVMGHNIEAIPMYNLREEALKFHTKGRGNGYVLTLDDERIYISGDTEDIPEMRSLKDIDKAFVCMNLPYTMTVESAADAVLEFKPKTVYPYHYRGTGGLSDIDKFKEIVTIGDPNIKVNQLNWYPQN